MRNASPEAKARKREKGIEYRNRPEIKAKLAQYRQRPDVKKRAQERQQRPDVKAEARRMRALWRKDHLEQAREEVRLWRINNPEKAKDSRKRSMQKVLDRDPDYFNRKRRERRRKFGDLVRAYENSMYRKDPRRKLARTRRWTMQNMEHVRSWRAARRAYQRGVTVLPIRPNFWHEAKLAWRGRCAYCDAECPNPERDHFVPLRRFGVHAEHNLVPACRTCNSQKKDKDPFVFLWERRRQKPQSFA
jgi:5-methylcytosine-specific restriction endonuclease McrA